MFSCGEVIAGRYEVLSHIGEGGMSHVHLARDIDSGSLCAIKEMKRFVDAGRREMVRRSFLGEAALMEAVEHPALPRVWGVLEHGGLPLVAMDYIEGTTLSVLVREEGPRPEDKVVAWGIQLAGVLCYLHTHNPPILYRDLKPANIIVDADDRVHLVDFGAARIFEAGSVPDAVGLGTRGYAAPEQFDSRFPCDERADVYGLGATLYHLLTAHDPAHPPYEIKPIRFWDPTLSAGLEQVIARCTAIDPDERFDSCALLASALEGVRLHGSWRGMRLWGHAKGVRALAIACACMLVVGTGLLVLGVTLRQHAYGSLLDEAGAQGDVPAAEMRCSEAIELCPGKPDAYLELIRLIGVDERFTLEEERLWQGAAPGIVPELQGKRCYGEVCYEMGRLYWFYYEYGSSDSARLRSSRPWFEAAAADEGFGSRRTADVYARVAASVQELAQKTSKGEETKDDHLACWQAANGLFGAVQEEQTQLGRALGLQTVARMLMEDHAAVARAGVPVAQMRALAGEVFDCARALEGGQRVLGLRDEILSCEGSLTDALDADEQEQVRTGEAVGGVGMLLQRGAGKR